ncbi:MAG: hypothetical protein CTY20_07940 [Hyphomicrobium sp.]|nr:MAG: hypothetical protein CTY20_07940 [Hyphomicrobium sp.]
MSNSTKMSANSKYPVRIGPVDELLVGRGNVIHQDDENGPAADRLTRQPSGLASCSEAPA